MALSRSGWLMLGIAIEIFHMAFAFGVLIFGKLWLPAYVVNLAIAITVFGQLIFLWCPLSVLSNYCFRKHNPELKFNPSLSLWLYGKFGRVIGIPIFLALFLISSYVAYGVLT